MQNNMHKHANRRQKSIYRIIQKQFAQKNKNQDTNNHCTRSYFAQFNHISGLVLFRLSMGNQYNIVKNEWTGVAVADSESQDWVPKPASDSRASCKDNPTSLSVCPLISHDAFKRYLLWDISKFIMLKRGEFQQRSPKETSLTHYFC